MTKLKRRKLKAKKHKKNFIAVSSKSYGKVLKGTRIYFEGARPAGLKDDGSINLGKRRGLPARLDMGLEKFIRDGAKGHRVSRGVPPIERIVTVCNQANVTLRAAPGTLKRNRSHAPERFPAHATGL